MAVDLTPAAFLTSYPEFSDAPLSLLQAKLNEATTLIQGPVWNNGDPARDLTQQATFLQAAHFLALSPYAAHMGLVKTDGFTLYSARLQHLKRIVTSGFRVL